MKLLFQCPCCSCFCFVKATNKTQGKEGGRSQGAAGVGKTANSM
ncbi:hypothetical protein BAE44_0025788 [Dichanthelium oligosanthes]|uniref:Uncharacterized protein n=1 Tax=Dichanthelium oligosanthes TaxID=888268 RepID=A0A1E5UJY6_9POAL|nr:hypothetical protein BAE44_0025788 [Dichanthelium oligosanthes]